MKQFYAKHSITVDAKQRIIDGWSDAFRKPTPLDTLLTDRGGYQFRLFPDGEENPALTEESGAHLWRYEIGVVRAATGTELEAERAEILANKPTPPPTIQQQVNDQVEAAVDLDYRLSMMELGLA